MTVVAIVELAKKGRPGDRATQDQAYSDYEIHVARDGEMISSETLVHYIDGYDHFGVRIINGADTLNKAMVFAERLAKRLDAKLVKSAEAVKRYVVVSRYLVYAADEDAALKEYESRFGMGKNIVYTTERA